MLCIVLDAIHIKYKSCNVVCKNVDDDIRCVGTLIDKLIEYACVLNDD